MRTRSSADGRRSRRWSTAGSTACSRPGGSWMHAAADNAAPPLTRVSWRDMARLVPSRYPSVGLFDRVASRDDLDAVLELENWTNDRVNTELGLLHAVPPDEWVVGRPM